LAHSLTPGRRGTLACALALAALALPATQAGAESTQLRDQGPLGMLGHAALAAIGSAGADGAVNRIGESLAMLAAQERVAALEASRPDPKPRPETEVPDYSNIKDPSELPPASAGSNGTRFERKASGELFARTPVSTDPESTSILLTGIALPPPSAPEAVKGVINNANMIVGRPYIWGGGHGSWYSNGYDCSGAVSFALFGGGLIPRPLTSGELEGWGAPGPGRWITVYANAGHTFATIAGLRWDTSGTESGTGPRWHVGARPSDGYVIRHPPGL
jgi:cell wall-associated NlpC family hydrolase